MAQTEKGFAHLALPVIALLILASAFFPVKRSYNDGKSNVVGVYLAKGGGDSSSVTSTPRPVKVETKREASEVKENEKVSERVETKVTPQEIKSEIKQGNLRLKFEIKDGKVEIETKVKSGENETELENEAENDAVNEVEAELEKEDVKVATAPGQIALVNKRAGALTNFPLSINPTTRQLTVTTPVGSKVVAVLPQKAIDNMLAAHVMDDVTSEKADNNLASIQDLVQMEVENGVLGYKIKGTKNHKLLGIIPFKTGVDAFVSAENGQVVQTQESLLAKILNRIAP